jgi:hypothetical protein
MITLLFNFPSLEPALAFAVLLDSLPSFYYTEPLSSCFFDDSLLLNSDMGYLTVIWRECFGRERVHIGFTCRSCR